MDQLEKWIRENKTMFNKEEPNIGHLARFESKLRQNARQKRIRIMYRISGIAAVGLIAILSSIWIYTKVNPASPGALRLGELNSELAEVEFYFTSQIDNLTSELDQLPVISENEYKTQMLSEINQMDSVYKNLQTELAAHPGDDRIVQAMILYYQTKMKVIQDILQQLRSIQDFNNSKSNQYESVNN